MELLLRADGDEALGTGHVMRCLSLAHAWRRFGTVALAARRLSPGLARRAEAAGVRVLEPSDAFDDRAGLTALAQERGAAAVVLDGYHLPAELQDMRAVPLLVLDDHGRWARSPPAVLDGNLAATPQTYPNSAVLSGPRYALLGPAFPPTPASPQRDVLVTLGGRAEPRLLRVVLAAVRGFRATLVLGTTQEDVAEITAEAEAEGIDVRHDVQNMADLMARHRIGIIAAGTTALEAAACGLPLLALAQADNQVPVLAALEDAGVGKSLGSAHDVHAETLRHEVTLALQSPSWLESAKKAGPNLVDGRGARRVAAWIRSQCAHVRSVNDGDRDMVLTWANDPGTRANSFQSDVIQPEEHARWWAAKAHDPGAHLAIVEADGPLGFVWFSVRGEAATISVNMAPSRRGQGWGAAVIRAGCDWLFGRREAREILAWVRPENQASRAVFLDAGFEEQAACHEHEVPFDGAVLFKLKPGPELRP